MVNLLNYLVSSWRADAHVHVGLQHHPPLSVTPVGVALPRFFGLGAVHRKPSAIGMGTWPG